MATIYPNIKQFSVVNWTNYGAEIVILDCVEVLKSKFSRAAPFDSLGGLPYSAPRPPAVLGRH